MQGDSGAIQMSQFFTWAVIDQVLGILTFEPARLHLRQLVEVLDRGPSYLADAKAPHPSRQARLDAATLLSTFKLPFSSILHLIHDMYTERFSSTMLALKLPCHLREHTIGPREQDGWDHCC